ncbi:trafficking protein particle complex subunit 6B [Echria macrotheca]|uniref:Trafficking protein particle complex subunit 6B n=1 Tax=Echria macrotheca TaxID=438768 RepID=A0AAJ0B2Y4_9PEZI|nr:trafficking protein particle complex subunit 6B [Echria macrotheca]
MSFDPVMPPYNASDPHARFLASSTLDFLLIELVPLTYRVAQQVDSPSPSTSPSLPSQPPSSQPPTTTGPQTITTTTQTITGATSEGTRPETLEEEIKDQVFYRLESLGYRVGQGLVERFSRDRPRFGDTLDVIKFLCKDLWTLVFRKQVDNLKTNHRGVYVLTDNAFRPFSRMSAEMGGGAVLRAQPFLWFPCGIVRGALAAMGINATVQAETSELPGAVFQIKTLGVISKAVA